jgi:MYXO-CTERM domain-containing protein
MTRLICRSTALVAVVAAGLFGSSARADLVVSAAIDAATPVQLFSVSGVPTDDLSDSFTGRLAVVAGATTIVTTGGLFRLSVEGAEAIEDTTGAQLLSSATSLTNVGTSGTHTVHLMITATDYGSPLTPPAVKFTSGISGTTVTGGAANALAFTAYVDPTNTPTTAGAYNNGVQSAPITVGGNTTWNSGTATSFINSLVAAFAMLQSIDFTLNQGSSLNYSSSQQLQSVPEPSSVVMAGFGALGLVGLAVRRRKAAKG